MSDIFLSYARNDRKTAERLAHALESAGWSVWWDRRIPYGQPYAKVIADALASAQCVVVLWSRHSIDRPWVRDEASYAQDRGILMPILVENVAPPFGFKSIQTADLTGWKGEDDFPAFKQVRNDIARLVPPTAAGPAPPRSPSKRLRRWAFRYAGGVVAVILSLAALAVLSFKTAPVVTVIDTSIIATRTNLAYRADRVNTGDRQTPLLDQVPASNLLVSSFETIEIGAGSLFRVTGAEIERPIESSIPIRLAARGGTAEFSDIWVRQLTVPKGASVHAAAIERELRVGTSPSPGVRLIIGPGASTVTLVRPRANEVVIKCVECSIDSALSDGDRRRESTQQLRITGIEPEILVKGQTDQLAMDLIPEDGGLDKERFPIAEARFCEDHRRDVPAIVSGKMTFGETDSADQLNATGSRPTVMTLTSSDIFVVSDVKLLPRDATRRPAFSIKITGPAKDVRIGTRCDDLTPIFPSQRFGFLRSLSQP